MSRTNKWALQTDEPAEVIPVERFIFNEQGIRISKIRFLNGDQTFALSGIVSVRTEKIPPSAVVPLLLYIMGAATVMYSYQLALLPVILGVVLSFLISGKSSVTIGTAGGEIRSFQSSDKIFVDRVVKALNQAIVDRG